MADEYLTQSGYEKLQKELEHLRTVKRKEFSKEIAKARSHGDISENAEYEAAKEAQGLNEKRKSLRIITIYATYLIYLTLLK